MISRKDCFSEIPTPQEVEKQEEPKMLGLIYRAVFMCLRVLLDMRDNNNPNRRNIVKKPEVKQESRPLPNPVIKGNIEIK